MSQKLYGLMVGINGYPLEVGRLEGCLNDVDHFHAYLRSTWDGASLALEVLKDEDATRENIIRLFRTHLSRAKEGDVAVFQYCGHGARWASAQEFREFYPDGRDEGLVCIDSRRPGGFDLADKELAVLIAEVARNHPHLAVILDCCHSGSGTRSADAFRGLKPRLTEEVLTERPLESYLDGHYSNLHRQKLRLSIPAGKHVLLAACERTQLAQESLDRSGVFTSTMLEVLRKSGGHLSYADLFVRCRAAVRSRAQDQNPQFEVFGDFHARTGFLGRGAGSAGGRYSVYFDRGGWQVDYGAIHGAPTEPEKNVAFVLFPEDDPARPAGSATAIQVGAQKSALNLGFESGPTVRYQAEITSLPVPPLPLYFAGDADTRAALETAFPPDGSVHAVVTDIEQGARYALSVEKNTLFLKQRETDRLIQGVAIGQPDLRDAAMRLLPSIRHVMQWERSAALQNLRTQIDPSLVDFVFSEQLSDGSKHVYPAAEFTLEFRQFGAEWKEIRGEFKARNRTQQTLHLMLAYFSADYGITILKNEPLEPGERWVTLWGDAPDAYFYLPEGANESIEHFKLIVSTEQVDGFLLNQDALELGAIAGAARAIGTVKPMNKIVHREEWFTKDYRIKVVRRLNQVGSQDAKLAAGRIVIKGHPEVTANLSLSAAKTGARSAAGRANFYEALQGTGMSLVNFAGTRGDNESILELTGIQNAASLQEHPLKIEVKVPLAEDEALLPLVFDGQHVILGGDAHQDDSGTTHISISHIPDVADQRRSLGGSLKLYFFKTYLRQDNVNQLRWVDYQADGSFQQQKSMLAEKVAGARNILLLVHGIIGDTEGMAAGVKACGLDTKFDLVLTYDYENLSTPIQETARTLKAQLAAAGIDATDNKRLTLLVHSMGGLVSRWFIEREGGNKMVDRLVMCGTPNNGSPFGKIDGARKILSMLTSLSINYLPAFIPFSSAALMLINRSKKLTPTLEQMNPESDFIRELNASDDPGIPYTILAGDVGQYQEPSDPFFAQMLAKTGRSVLFDLLFAQQANDIAVGVESILGVGGPRAIPPVRTNVACHHMNYFVSQAGQKALVGVDW